MADAFNEMLRAKSKRDGWRDCCVFLTVSSFLALILSSIGGPWPIATCAIGAAFSLQRMAEWSAKAQRAESRYVFFLAIRREGKSAPETVAPPAPTKES